MAGPSGKPQKQAVAQLTWFRAQIADFSGIPQPQLKAPAKRWIRWRLSTGLEASAGGTGPPRALTRFAVFLDARGITGTSGIDRAVMRITSPTCLARSTATGNELTLSA